MLNHPGLLPTHLIAPSRQAGPDMVEALYGAARDPHRWPDTMSQLAAYVGGVSAMVASCDLARGVVSVATSAEDAGRDGADLSEVWRLAREVVRRRTAAVAAAGTGSAVVIEVASADAGLRPAHLVLPHLASCGDDRAGWISVALPAARPLSGKQAIQRFSSLGSHLTRALDISLELTQARDAGPSLALLLSALPTAALMLDEDGRVLQANSAARAILTDADGIRQSGDRRLEAGLAGEDQKLASAVRASLAASRDGQVPNRLVLRLDRAAGRPPLLVIFDPVPPRHRASATGTVLLRLIDEEHALGDRIYPLQAAFDLTAAEMRTAALIAAGLSPAVVARRLDVSTNTVRTHLARVFDKTGVRTQHALTLLLAAIGSWPLP